MQYVIEWYDAALGKWGKRVVEDKDHQDAETFALSYADQVFELFKFDGDANPIVSVTYLKQENKVIMVTEKSQPWRTNAMVRRIRAAGPTHIQKNILSAVKDLDYASKQGEGTDTGDVWEVLAYIADLAGGPGTYAGIEVANIAQLESEDSQA